MKQARVTAAYATVRVLDPATGKPTVRGFYENAVLPEAADAVNVESLVNRGYAEWVDDSPAEVPPADPEPGKDAPPANPTPPQAATKADWVAYAVAQRAEGVSEADAQAEAEAKSKADLIAEFGS